MGIFSYIISIIIVFISIIFFCNDANSASGKETINILTWWNYINQKEFIKMAEKKCNVKISFDQYYSNDEFLRRWSTQKDDYQVIIFSDTIYNTIKNKIPGINNSNLTSNLKQYNKTIQKHYLNRHYPPNIVYFAHAMIGFLWNPEKINISAADSINSIFKKAKHNYVVLIDDSSELAKLIEASLDNSRYPHNNYLLTTKYFKEMISDAQVYITNNYSQIYTKPDFAFAFNWSGEAMADLITSNKKYKFLIHPKLSYISSDLLAQTSNSRGSQCVASWLSSKEAIDILQEKNLYFSPYTDYSKISNPVFKKIYMEFVELLPNLAWFSSINEKDFYHNNTAWQLIKLSLNTQAENQ